MREPSLRTKLALIFVGLAVVPCLSLTLLVSRQLTEAIEFWSNQGLQRSFTSSVAVARESLRLLEVHLAATVERAAAEGTPARTDLDVWRIYERRGDDLVLHAAEASAAGLIVTPEVIESALAAGPESLIRLDDGWLLAVAPLDSAATRVLVGGYRVPAELAGQIEATRQGARHLGELGLYKAVHQGWVWISAIMISLIVIGSSIFLSRRLARGMTRPIEGMVGAMAQLSRGESPAALQPPTDSEMGYLVRSFNSMADELEHSRRELQRAERLAAWRDIARKVAHEIKNPLTPIQFAIHRLKKRLGETAAGSPQIDESLDSILGEVETLRSIAESFSQLGKLPDPQLEQLQAAAILRAVAELFQEPGVEQQLLIDPQLPEIRADHRQLRQVFNNLIQNAVEAMPGGGCLTVSAAPSTTGDELVIEISNSTGAIPADNLDRIWEPYFTSKQSGTGLGLAVVGKIVGDHGGRIQLTNQPEGGVCARLVLPAVKPTVQDSPPASRTAGTGSS